MRKIVLILHKISSVHRSSVVRRLQREASIALRVKHSKESAPVPKFVPPLGSFRRQKAQLHLATVTNGFSRSSLTSRFLAAGVRRRFECVAQIGDGFFMLDLQARVRGTAGDAVERRRHPLASCVRWGSF